MIKIELHIEFSEILDIKYRNKNGVKVLTIEFKNTDKITLYGDQAVSVFKKLSRNKAGEQLE